MTFTLEELQHIMATMNGNGSWVESNHEVIVMCPICCSARKKLEAMILEMTPRKLEKGEKMDKPVPEWMGKLGVNRIEVCKE